MKNPTIILLILSCLLITSCSDSGLFDGAYLYEELPANEQYTDYGENPFVKVSEQAISTFSVDADGGSYANMRRFLTKGYNIPSAAIRVEEFLNYFTFDYAEPTNNESVALNSELATCPWNTNHYLMRLGMKGKSLDQSKMPNSNYVFLIDVSGSMSSEDKLEILKAGFIKLISQLKANDKISIVTYAGSSDVLLNSASGTETRRIENAIKQLGAGGSTAGAEGIVTAYELAEQNFIEGGNNRVILGSDGDFNVGPSSNEELIELIEEKRESGIYFTVLGVGDGNLNDSMMEQIANKGNGTYEYIDNAKQIEKVFVYEYSKFFTVAKDSKIQITFNESKVDSFRLIGYENRSLNEEDFEKDSTDAGEIGAGQTITALYELVLSDNVEGGEIANFDFRYKFPDEEESRLLKHTISDQRISFQSASENMKFATAVGGFGLLLKDSNYKSNVSKSMVLDLSANAITFDEHGFRSEFRALVEKWEPNTNN